MAESLLSVCWKGYVSELASEYKSLLKDNFLVDCTLSAEGQSLKAHRLVLSACSPYFHMLFREECGKHPFVILLNASFETLKALIDFVYRGEMQIPQGNFKEFLTLGQALQIKGLNALLRDNNNVNLSNNTTEDVPQESSENNQDTRGVDVLAASLEMSLENYSQQHPQPTHSYSDTAQTNPLVPIKEFSALCEKELSTTLMTPLPEHHRPPHDDEVSINSELTIKHEPLCHVFSENRNEIFDSVQSLQHTSRNFMGETNVTVSVCSEEDLNSVSSCSKFPFGNVESSLIPPVQQRPVQLTDVLSFGGDVAERGDSSQPSSSALKTEHLDDEIDERLDDCDMPLNNRNETSEGMDPSYSEPSFDESSSADCLLLEEDVATLRRSLPGQQSTSSPPHTEPQLHEGRHAHPGELTDLGDEGGVALALSPSTSSRKPRRAMKRPFRCDVCQKAFVSLSKLATHERTHTGERPFRCDLCGKGFARLDTLNTHLRFHTGERLFRCDECGKGFITSSNLNTHMLCHTEERPYRCDECFRGFTTSTKLDIHMRCHTGERPYPCDVCGKGFFTSGSLNIHMRCHTGERPFRCDECGKGFTQSGNLERHALRHTGERTYRCDECGKGFARSDHLSHRRRHMGNRQYCCDECGSGFLDSGQLKKHMRCHMEERP